MKRVRKAGALCGVVTMAALLSAPPATASATAPGVSLVGCSGTGISLTSSGRTLQVASAPNPPSSSDRPLEVDANGTVRYHGSSASVITNDHWSIQVDGITVQSGGGANRSHRTSRSGTFDIASDLPFRITGLAYVTGQISGDGGSCSGSIWIEIDGNPAGTVPWYSALLLSIAGLAGIIFSRPKVVA